MDVTVTIKGDYGFKLEIKSKSLIPIVALNKILSELKDIESLDALMEEGKHLKKNPPRS